MTPTPAGLLGLAAAGAGAGALGSILGIGGGVFLVPCLVLIYAMPMTAAVGTGLVSIIATSSAVASHNVQKGLVNMRLGMLLELATVLGALAGAAAASMLPARLLIGLFGLLQAVMGVLLWRGPAPGDGASRAAPAGRLGGEYYDAAEGRRVVYAMRRLPVGLAVSFGAGGLSGLLGVGGGVFKVPALHLFCGVPMKAAAATSNFMIGVTAAASAFLYYGRGEVRPLETSAAVLGVAAGSFLGTHASARLKDASVRRAFALLLAYLAAQMLRRAWHV